jgi:hypothetical protein
MRSFRPCATPNAIRTRARARRRLFLINVERNFYAEDAPPRIERTSEAIRAMVRAPSTRPHSNGVFAILAATQWFSPVAISRIASVAARTAVPVVDR